jgi:hypothetical protein
MRKQMMESANNYRVYNSVPESDWDITQIISMVLTFNIVMFVHPVHTAPSAALLSLGCYWPCRNTL